MIGNTGRLNKRRMASAGGIAILVAALLAFFPTVKTHVNSRPMCTSDSRLDVYQ